MRGLKKKVEQIQADPTQPNSEDILKEIYQDLLKTDTALQASEIAKDVALSKVSELQAQVSNLEIDAAGNIQTDNPDLMVLNKLMDAAQGWSDVALPKVKDALNKIYLSLFNSTIEEWQVKDNLDNLNETWVSLNEATAPVGEVEKAPEEFNVEDITSVLG